MAGRDVLGFDENHVLGLDFRFCSWADTTAYAFKSNIPNTIESNDGDCKSLISSGIATLINDNEGFNMKNFFYLRQSVYQQPSFCGSLGDDDVCQLDYLDYSLTKATF